MKEDTHPDYQKVLFVDSSTGHKFVCGSTLTSKETEEFEGVEYPVCRVSVSSSSHPFFTGSQQFVDTEGRVDKFKKRYAKAAVKPKPKVAKKVVPAKKKSPAEPKPKAEKKAAPEKVAKVAPKTKAKAKPAVKAKDKPTPKKTPAKKTSAS